jgi:hypothetical protein
VVVAQCTSLRAEEVPAGQHLGTYRRAAETNAARLGFDHDERVRKRLDDGQA